MHFRGNAFPLRWPPFGAEMHFRGNAFPRRWPPLGRKCISAIGTFGSSFRVHLRVDRERGCSSHAPGTLRATPAPPRRPRARRPHGRRLPAGVLLLWGVSCAQRVVPSFHTGAQGGRRPATCVCAVRPLRARTVFLREIAHSHTRRVRWPGRTRSCCASECPWSVPVRPEWPCLSVCLLQSCVRACRAPAACRTMCFDGWCPNCRPREHSVVARRGLELQRGGSRRPHNRWYLPRQVVLYRCMFHCEQSGD